jgi:hypothetical protein
MPTARVHRLEAPNLFITAEHRLIRPAGLGELDV